MSGSDRSDSVLVFGLDCTTDPHRAGVALGLWNGSLPAVVETAAEDEEVLVDRWITERIRAYAGSGTLLAINAPLGWSAAIQTAQEGQSAANPIDTLPAHFFQRATDRFVAQFLKLNPDTTHPARIGQATLSGLLVMSKLSRRLGESIPVVWNPQFPSTIGAVEVSPAAVLESLGASFSGYDQPMAGALRAQILERLAGQLRLEEEAGMIAADVRRLNALLCVIGGADFLAGTALPPEDLALAQREGWIWVRGS